MKRSKRSTLVPDLRSRLPTSLPHPEILGRVDRRDVDHLMRLIHNPLSLASVINLIDGVLPLAAREAGATSEEIAAAELLRATPAALEMNLEHAVALGVLLREGARYRATRFTRAFLLDDSPVRLTALARRQAYYLRDLERLHEAFLRQMPSNNRLWSASSERDEQASHFTQRQVYSAASLAYFAETAAVLYLALDGVGVPEFERAVDLCSGPAAFAGLMSMANPGAEFHAVDVCFSFADYRSEVARWLEASGARVELIAGNVLHDPLPTDADVVFMNRLLSGVAEENAGPWLERAGAVLAPGGTLVLIDYFYTGDRDHDVTVSNLYACWALKDYVGHLEIADDSGTGDADPRRVWGWLSRWTRPALEAALEAAGLALRRFTPACSPLSVALAERIG